MQLLAVLLDFSKGGVEIPQGVSHGWLAVEDLFLGSSGGRVDNVPGELVLDRIDTARHTTASPRCPRRTCHGQRLPRQSGR